MKLGSTKICKIALIIALCLTVAGMTLLGVLGFNKTVDYSSKDELMITLEGNYGSTDKATEYNDLMQDAVEDYLTSKGAKFVGFATETLGNGSTLIYKFADDVSDLIVVADIETAVNEKVDAEGLSATAKLSNTAAESNAAWGYVAIALAVAGAVAFIYLIFMEKLSGSVATLISALASVILFISMIAIVRVPADPFVVATAMLAFILSGVYSAGIVNRCSELYKNVGNDKLSYEELGETATAKSLFRVTFVSGLLLLASIAFIAFGPTYLRYLGIQLVIATIVSTFSSMSFTGVLWGACKKLAKDSRSKKSVKKQQTETEQTEQVEQ